MNELVLKLTITIHIPMPPIPEEQEPPAHESDEAA